MATACEVRYILMVCCAAVGIELPEPVMALELSAPEDNTGDFVGDITRRTPF